MNTNKFKRYLKYIVSRLTTEKTTHFQYVFFLEDNYGRTSTIW